MDATMQHIRVQLPKRGGNNFYLDRRDFSHLAKTLCGAPITDRDVTAREGKTKMWRKWPGACPECLKLSPVK